MSKRGLGLVLVLMFAVFAAAAAGFADFRLDDLIARDRLAADTTQRSLAAAQLGLADLRTAEAAYVAPDQSAEFWFKRGTQVAAELEQQLGSLETDTAAPAAR